jgi:hypothetical protein
MALTANIYRRRTAMKRILLSTTLLMLSTAPSFAQVRIKFPAGSDAGAWAGYTTGNTSFKLNARRGQALWVTSDEVYTWSAVSPSGLRIGCGGSSYCVPGASMALPESGDYIINTSYRMSGGATAERVSKRYVTVMFTIR